MKSDSDPSFSEELDDLPEWDRSFWLSRAFIEASRRLCEDMLDGEFTSQYSSSRVIWHLTRQGVELFLKAAIGALRPHGPPLTHNLDALFSEYRNLYPDLAFFFELPPEFRVSPTLGLFLDDDRVFHSNLDQRHRYASDRFGNSFATRETFDPHKTMSQLEELDRVLKILEWAKIRPFLRGEPLIG